MSAATPNDLADDEILIDISELDELEGGEFDFEMDDSDIDIEDWPDSMLDINSVQLTGRLGRDPVLKEIGNDQVVCTFSMAVKHEWDPSSTSEEDTSWFDIEIWGSLGKYAAQYGRKGLRVGVSGEIDVQGWIDRNGEKCSNPIITADSFEVLQSKNESTPSSYGDRTTEDIRRTNDVSKSSRTDDRYSGIQVDGNLSDLPF